MSEDMHLMISSESKFESEAHDNSRTVGTDGVLAHSDEAGFSLLETAIAMVLLAIVGLGIASVFFFAAKNNVSAGDRQLAMAVAQQRMEQLRNASFTSSTLDATASTGASTTITRAGRIYLVNTTIANSSSIDGVTVRKTITVRVTPWSDGSSWARNVSSIFGSVTVMSERTVTTVGPNRAL
jgi:type II secretory pathway pseudopilin PulG